MQQIDTSFTMQHLANSRI